MYSYSGCSSVHFIQKACKTNFIVNSNERGYSCHANFCILLVPILKLDTSNIQLSTTFAIGEKALRITLTLIHN